VSCSTVHTADTQLFVATLQQFGYHHDLALEF